MTGPNDKSKTSPPSSNAADPGEPLANTVAVSVRSTLKTKSTATKSIKCAPNGPKEQIKLLGKVKNFLRRKPVSKACCDWPESEVLLCNILAWIGALVIVGVVFRSLYLMYCKPEEV